MAKTRRLILFLVMLMACRAARASIVYAPPDESADAANEVKAIDRELTDGNFAAAAKRLDALLGARGNPLAALAEGTLTSADAWVDRLSADRRTAMAAACERLGGGAARQALASLESARPDELYALARRHPMTAAAGAALAAAGDRALALGDLSSAGTLYDAAAGNGFHFDDAHARRIDMLRRVNAGTPLPAPSDLPRSASDMAAASHPTDRVPFAGPLPFDATWFGSPALTGRALFFPAAYDDHVVLASWNGVSLIGRDGRTLWHAHSPTAGRGAAAVERATPSGRGVPFAPAVLCDVHGRPAIVVARQATVGGYAQCALRAYRGDDGTPLWSTETTDPRKEMSYGGLPAVAGRYVYSVAALQTGVSTADLLLCALDTASGKPIWQTVIGSVAEQGDDRGRMHGGGGRGGGKNIRSDPIALESFADLSAPAVAGDLVITAPNCGAVIAVGRFDGRIRWVSVYRPGEGARTLLTRYTSTPVVCGEAVVALPQDVSALLAFDRCTGKPLWQTDASDAYAVAGASGDVAVVCGRAITGVDTARAGAPRWRFTPVKSAAITGPAVVVGDTVIAPTAQGLLQISATDGSLKPAYAVPDFRQMLSAEPGRNAVFEAGAAQAFGQPTGPR